MPEKTDKKFFSVQEARECLPSLRKHVVWIMALSERLESSRESIQQLAEDAAVNRGSPQGTAYLEDLIALQAEVARVHQKGCLITSIREGLVDFPHLREGREVYLCWKYGEADIHFWHEIDAGFAGRVPLEE